MITSPESDVSSWPELLEMLLQGQNLSVGTAAWAMDRLMSGELADVQIGGFLTALRAKGETGPELLGLSEAMMGKSEPIAVHGPALDIVGTGGDRLGTVNISTMSSLVAVGAGARVVKHGNRGASTTAGAADVIEALGVDLSLPVQRLAAAAAEVGITFLFAQNFHPAMRYVMPARKQLGVRTVFNFLGPLSNPARPEAQALGCASEELAPRIAEALAGRGTRGFVFRGRDGRDKITISDSTDLWEVRQGEVTHLVVHPEDFGITPCAIDDLRGGSPQHNAKLVRQLLAGQEGPIRDAVLVNAAAGLTALDTSADGDVLSRMRANLIKAAESIDSGAAEGVLSRWAAFTS